LGLQRFSWRSCFVFNIFLGSFEEKHFFQDSNGISEPAFRFGDTSRVRPVVLSIRLSEIDPECAFDRHPRKLYQVPEDCFSGKDPAPAQVCSIEVDRWALNQHK